MGTNRAVTYYPKRDSFAQLNLSSVSHTEFIASLSPLLEFRFDDASGNVVNYGSAGSDATPTGMATYGVAGNPIGRDAIRLDASPEYFSMTDDASLNLQSFSWITTFRWYGNGLAASPFGRLFQWGSTTAFFNNGRQIVMECVRSGGTQQHSPPPDFIGTATPTDWLTNIITVNGTTVTQYAINGTLNNTDSDATGSGTINAHGTQLDIGNRSTDGLRQSDIDLGELVYTSSVITPAQVAQYREIVYNV